MERYWKYCVLFFLIKCVKASASWEVCGNIKETVVLDCGSRVPGEESTVAISNVCLCYSSACSSCFCVIGDWDLCRGMASCTFHLSEADLSRLRSELSGFLVFLLRQTYVKVKYSCTPALRGKTTKVQTPEPVPTTKHQPKTTKTRITSDSPNLTSETVTFTKRWSTVTRSVEPEDDFEGWSRGTGYVGMSNITGGFSRSEKEPNRWRRGLELYQYMPPIASLLTIALVALLLFVFSRKFQHITVPEHRTESAPSPEVVVVGEKEKPDINQLYLSETLKLPEK